MLNIDFWYDNKITDIAYIDYTFYPNEGLYRGNIYDKARAAIGDYTTADSTEIEAIAPDIFGA